MRPQIVPLTPPALKRQSPAYPVRFDGRVPKEIVMERTVYPDPELRPLRGIAWKGHRYLAWTDEKGNVSALVPHGVTISPLALAPQEFRVVEWFEQ